MGYPILLYVLDTLFLKLTFLKLSLILLYQNRIHYAI